MKDAGKEPHTTKPGDPPRFGAKPPESRGMLQYMYKEGIESMKESIAACVAANEHWLNLEKAEDWVAPITPVCNTVPKGDVGGAGLDADALVNGTGDRLHGPMNQPLYKRRRGRPRCVVSEQPHQNWATSAWSHSTDSVLHLVMQVAGVVPAMSESEFSDWMHRLEHYDYGIGMIKVTAEYDIKNFSFCFHGHMSFLLGKFWATVFDSIVPLMATMSCFGREHRVEFDQYFLAHVAFLSILNRTFFDG